MRNFAVFFLLVLPLEAQQSAYTVRGEWAVVEGDMIVGRVQPPNGKGTGSRSALVVPFTANNRWPRVGNQHEIPYTNPTGMQGVEDAVRAFNQALTGVIQMVPRTNQADYVEFELNVGDCSMASAVGRTGGRQVINGTAPAGPAGFCLPVFLHEIGHSVGLFHEQSRSDRDGHVRINWANIEDRTQYDKESNAVDTGFYDSASIMHYQNSTFARNPADVTMFSIPTGIPLKGGLYSPGDLDVIRRMHSVPPAQVTVATNPPGLQISGDDRVVLGGSAQASFAWDLNTNHVLDVPQNLQVQDLAGVKYIFGRWNHLPYDAAQPPPARQTITVGPGDGGQDTLPANRPRFTVYQANFRQLMPVADLEPATITPAAGAFTPNAAGEVTLEPGVMVQGNAFYYAEQPVTIQARPAVGFNFYGWSGTAVGESNTGANPRTILARRRRRLEGRFTQSPVTLVNTVPAGLAVTMDANAVAGTKAFALPFDNTWTVNSRHTVAVASPQASVVDDAAARHVFRNWSDGGTPTHEIAVGANNLALTANFSTQFPLRVNQTRGCEAEILTVPAAADLFFDAGTAVNLTLVPKAGLSLVRVDGATAGNVTMDGSKTVTVVTNTVNEVLAVTGLEPAAVPVANAEVALTINGTGFDANSAVCFFLGGGGPCGQVTFVSQNRLNVMVPADLLKQAQTLDVRVFNEADGCRLSAGAPLPVRAAPVP